MQELGEDTGAGDEATAVSQELLKGVEAALEAGDDEALHGLVGDLHEADLADLMELLRPDERTELINRLGADFEFATLSELDETVRDQVVEAMPNEQVAEAVRELESDDAVYLLENLEEGEKSDILSRVPKGERAQLERSLAYPEDSAGRLMRTEFIAVPPFWTVGQAIDYMRETDDLPDSFSELYVIDPAVHLLGEVALARLLRTKRPVAIEEIMERDLKTVAVTLDQEEVARLFERYDLYSAPVVDEDARLVGVVTVDDVVEVIQEEAEEDIKRLGGVGDESIADTVLRIAGRRFPWLLVNLATSLLASAVISAFDATIEQMVALAVLMPIVASMGGNAGTQTMTIAVRALATRELSVVNARRIISREVIVGMLNGLMFALIMGVVTYLWFGSGGLGLVIAAAMVINLLVAGLFGIIIPMTLEHYDIDPAIASSVFVTTVTDVVGFFAFLGIAAVWLV